MNDMEKSKKVFEGRRSTLKKKASELATLCNVEVCVVCFGPDGDLQVWQENPKEAQSIIGKYREASKKGSKCKRKEKPATVRGKRSLISLISWRHTIKKLERQPPVEEDKTWDDFGDGNIGGLALG